LLSSLIVCDYGYGSQSICNIGLYVDQEEVCAGEQFLLGWDVTLTDTGVREDFIQITPPGTTAPYNGSSYSWSMADMTYYVAHQPSLKVPPQGAPNGPRINTWQWFFLDTNIRSYTAPTSIRDYLTQGAYAFSFSGGEAPGAYGISFMRGVDDGSGNSTVWAVATVRLLPSTHARCMALNNNNLHAAAAAASSASTTTDPTPSCGAHGTLVNTTGVYSCTCDAGYYGYQCQYGCSTSQMNLTGTTSTTAGWNSQGVYTNDDLCTWSVSPPVAPDGSRVSAVVLQFADFSTEANRDIVTVYSVSNNSYTCN
jgi:hypothetical protein